MTREDRDLRRAAGALAVGLASAKLGLVEDRRGRRGRRWQAAVLLRAMLVGMLAGMHSLKETESLTARLGRAMRQRLGIGRRVPDTTMRGMAMATPWRSVLSVLHAQVRAAGRKKQLEPAGLPCGVLAIDGKVVCTDLDDGEFGQEQGDGVFAVRTMSCALVSGPATVTVHVSPVPRGTNEMAWFGPTLREVVAAFGRGELFGLVTTDAGMTSKANADLVHHETKLGYLFALKGNQPELRTEAERLLSTRPEGTADARTRERIGRHTHVRHVWLTDEIAGYHDWDHLRTAIRVRYQVVEDGGMVVRTMDRYFISNERPGRFTPSQWLHVVRAHWSVENDVHKTLDVALGEDDHPWIRAVPGMLVTQVLRRVACNSLNLLRSLTLRPRRRTHRGRPLLAWSTLFARLEQALLAASEFHVDGLRWARDPVVAPC